LLLGVIGVATLDVRLTLLHDGLGDPHASGTADGAGAERVKSDADDQRQSHDRQSVTGDQSVEKIQDRDQQVVGDVPDHVEGPVGEIIVMPVCSTTGSGGESLDRLAGLWRRSAFGHPLEDVGLRLAEVELVEQYMADLSLDFPNNRMLL